MNDVFFCFKKFLINNISHVSFETHPAEKVITKNALNFSLVLLILKLKH